MSMTVLGAVTGEGNRPFLSVDPVPLQHANFTSALTCENAE